MASPHILDDYYLGLTLIITVTYQLLGFAIAWSFKFDKITDFTGGSNFFLLALVTYLLGNHEFASCNTAASIMVWAWSIRLSSFLLARVLERGKDGRFDEIRSHFFKFLGFWILQMIWVWVVSLPVTILNSPAMYSSAHEDNVVVAFVGIIVGGLALFGEATADNQKPKFRRSKPPRDKIPNMGWWGWSRHPPYFFEMAFWWAIWMVSISRIANGTVRALQYVSAVSPVFTFLILMFLSGMPTAERPTARRFYLLTYGPGSLSPNEETQSSSTHLDAWNKYKAYCENTSILVPIPPVLYKLVPTWVKRTLLMDWKIYQFDETIDGPKAVEKEKRKRAMPPGRSG